MTEKQTENVLLIDMRILHLSIKALSLKLFFAMQILHDANSITNSRDDHSQWRLN